MATRLFGSQTSLREANRANLLASIHKFGAMTQVELAEVTGLSTATVSTLVHQLVDEDQLETKNTVRNGRRATLVTLARHQGLGVGLWIARRHLTLSAAVRSIRARSLRPRNGTFRFYMLPGSPLLPC